MRRVSAHPRLMLDLLGTFELGLVPGNLGASLRDALVLSSGGGRQSLTRRGWPAPLIRGSMGLSGMTEEEVQTVEDCVDSILDRHPQLRKGHDKKVFELQPHLDWHKGKAVLWLLEAITETLDCDPAAVVTVYIGDDTTDEDAFQTLAAS